LRKPRGGDGEVRRHVARMAGIAKVNYFADLKP
jgi:hypothetical protein